MHAPRLFSSKKRWAGLLAALLVGAHVDAGLAQNKMYWTNFTSVKIQRANLDGSSVEDLVTTGLSEPTGIALDVAAGKMYWTDESIIKRANLDGTGVENLVYTPFSSFFGIALDVPPPVKPLVFLANKITLERTKQHTPAGDMHSNGTLTVSKGDPSTYNSNLTAVGKITFQKDNTINGAVNAPNLGNSGTINGTTTIGPVATEPLPSFSYNSSGPN